MRPSDFFDFSGKVLIDSWCISKRVHHVSDHGVMSFGMRDFNSQVRMCCEISLRLCVDFNYQLLCRTPDILVFSSKMTENSDFSSEVWMRIKHEI